jgi:hypothetical protein
MARRIEPVEPIAVRDQEAGGGGAREDAGRTSEVRDMAPDRPRSPRAGRPESAPSAETLTKRSARLDALQGRVDALVESAGARTAALRGRAASRLGKSGARNVIRSCAPAASEAVAQRRRVHSFGRERDAPSDPPGELGRTQEVDDAVPMSRPPRQTAIEGLRTKPTTNRARQETRSVS